MDIKKFREVIVQHIYVDEISDGEWDEELDRCRAEEVKLLTEDMPSTLEFLKNECTADEYSWISESLDEIADTPHGAEFIECYKSLLDKFPEEDEKYNISGVLKCAEDIIKWNKEHEGGKN